MNWNRTQPHEPAPAESKEAAGRKTTLSAEELEERYLRLLADMDNLRKRAAAEQQRTRRHDQDTMIRAWLEVVDNIERALDAYTDDVEQLRAGVSAIHRQALAVLGESDVAPLETDGYHFDPRIHEAVGTLTATDQHAPGTVVHTARTGYTRDGEVLRPARVIVAQGK